MNKLILFLSSLSLLLALAACQDGNDFGEGYAPSLSGSTQPKIVLTVSTPSTFANTDGEQNLEVTCNIGGWTVRSSETWCTVQKTGDTGLKVTVAENTSTDSRTATITFYYGSETLREITVTQQGKGKHTTASPGSGFPAVENGAYTLDTPDATTLTINVTSNEGWTATSSNTALCTVEHSDGSNNGKVTVTVKQNTTKDSREATITIVGTDSGDKTSFTVKQPGIQISVSPGSLEFDAAKGSKNLTVTSNTIHWTVESSDESWCKATMSGNTVTVTVTENTSTTSERKAVVTVKAGKVTPIEINVTQKKKEIAPYTRVTSETSITLDKPDEITVPINIESNESWTAAITKNPDNSCTLISPADGKGSGVGTLTVKLAKNATEKLRTVEITITGKSSGQPTTVSVSQPGTSYYIAIDGEKDQTVDSSGGPLTVKVRTNDAPFQVGSDASWCTVVERTSDSFKLEVNKNGTLSKRRATITVTSKSGKKDTMTVTQKAGKISREEYD